MKFIFCLFICFVKQLFPQTVYHFSYNYLNTWSDWSITNPVGDGIFDSCVDSVTGTNYKIYGGRKIFQFGTSIKKTFQTSGKNAFYNIKFDFRLFRKMNSYGDGGKLKLYINNQFDSIYMLTSPVQNAYICRDSEYVLEPIEGQSDIIIDSNIINFELKTDIFSNLNSDWAWGVYDLKITTSECDNTICSLCSSNPRNCTQFCNITCNGCYWNDPNKCLDCFPPNKLNPAFKCTSPDELTILNVLDKNDNNEMFVEFANLNGQNILQIQSSFPNFASSCGSSSLLGGYIGFGYNSQIKFTIDGILEEFYAIRLNFRFFKIDHWAKKFFQIYVGNTVKTLQYETVNSELTGSICGENKPNAFDIYPNTAIDIISIYVFENKKPLDIVMNSTLSSSTKDKSWWGIRDVFITIYVCPAVCKTCSGNKETDCIECAPGYIKLNGLCTHCSVQCLTCETWANRCTSCDKNNDKYKYFYRNDCVENCPDSFYPDISGVCKDCSVECAKCSAFKKCLECNPNFFKLNDRVLNCLTQSQIPQGYFANLTTHTADLCDVSCSSCINQATACTSCGTDYFNSTFHQKCVRVCEPGTFPDLITKSCTPCHNFCELCYGRSNLNCTSCKSSYYFYENSCLSNCVAPLVEDGASRKCLKCDEPCKICTINSTRCTSCISGTFLYFTECLKDCPPRYFADSKNNLCGECDKTCALCAGSATYCVECENSLFLNKQINQCVMRDRCPGDTIPLLNKCENCIYPCASCNDTASKCSFCKDGLFLQPNKTCLQNCNTSYFPNTNTFTCDECDVSCLNCKGKSNTQCTECPNDKYLFNGSCETYCPETYYPDFQFKQCISCADGCKTCLNKLVTSCSACIIDYYLYVDRCVNDCPNDLSLYENSQTQKCEKCESACKECLSSSKNNCNKCNENYFLYKTTCDTSCPETSSTYPNKLTWKCENCDLKCKSCVGPTSKDCISCPDESFLYNGECLLDCSIIPNYYGNKLTGKCERCLTVCKKCFGANNNCSECIQGYNLLENSCLSNCPPNFYVNDDKCAQCFSPCENCTSKEDCLDCIKDFYLYGQICRQDCPDGYYPSIDTKKCEKCHTSCLLCKDATNTSCTSCIKEFFRDKTTCLQKCPEGKYGDDSHICQLCNEKCSSCYGLSEKQCYHCAQKYFLMNNTCLTDCGISYFGDLNNLKCTQCHQSCKECKDGTKENCQSCNKNYFFLNNTCFDICPDGYYKDEIESKCLKCDTSCKTCFGGGTDQCKSCELNKYLYSKQCLTECPNSYYGDYNISECRLCDPSCKECMNKTKCTQCFYGKYFYKNACLEKCPFNTWINEMNCKDCHELCETCSGPKDSECNSCKINFFLYNNNCDLKCPKHLFADDELRQCIKKCDFTCKDCVGPNKDECNFCADNSKRFINNTETVGECICPSRYYSKDRELKDPICGKCSVMCTECDGPSSKQCTNCPANKRLVNKECKCYEGQYPLQDGEICQFCNPACENCNGPTERNCTSCDNRKNRIMSIENTCVCKEGFFEEETFCEKCHYSCKKCQGRENYHCLPNQCVGNHIYNQVKHTCECPFWAEDFGINDNCTNKTFLNCYYTCADRKCFGLDYDNCYSCAPLRTFVNNTCPCSIGYYENSNTMTCERCHMSCKKCDGPYFSNCIDECSSITRGDYGVPIKGVCNCMPGHIDNLEEYCPKTPLSLDSCRKSFDATLIINTPSMGIIAFSASPIVAIKFMETCQLLTYLSYLNLQYPLNTKDYFVSMNYFNLDPIFGNYNNNGNNTNNLTNETNNSIINNVTNSSHRILSESANQFERVKYGEGTFINNAYVLILINVSVFGLVLLFSLFIKLGNFNKEHVLYKIKKQLEWGVPIRIFALSNLQLFFYIGLQFSQPNFLSTSPINIAITIIIVLIIIITNLYLFRITNTNYSKSEFSHKFSVIWDGTDAFFFIKRNYFFFNLIRKIFIVAFILQTTWEPSRQIIACLVISGTFLFYVIIFKPFLTRINWVFNILLELGYNMLLAVILIYTKFSPDEIEVKLTFGYIIIFSIILIMVCTLLFSMIQIYRFIVAIIQILKIKKTLLLDNSTSNDSSLSSLEKAFKSYKTELNKKNKINVVYSKEKEIDAYKKELELKKKEEEIKRIEQLEKEKSERSGLKTVFQKHRNKTKKKKKSVEMDLDSYDSHQDNGSETNDKIEQNNDKDIKSKENTNSRNIENFLKKKKKKDTIEMEMEEI